MTAPNDVLERTEPSSAPAVVVRPADLVSALTGLALLFFALIVKAVADWDYLGPDTDHVSALGWVTPLLVGGVCLISALVSIVVRAIRVRAGRR